MANLTAYNDWTDIQLVRAIGNDDAQAMGVLYQRYWKVLFLSAWNVLQDKEVVEDLLHDVFCSFWVRRKELDKVELPAAYLKKSIRYSVYNYIRNHKVRKDVFADLNERLLGLERANESIIEQKELTLHIENAINSLPEQCRQVFILSRRDDLSNKEIAAHLNISPKTVERHITIAFKKLKEYLSKTQMLLVAIILLFN